MNNSLEKLIHYHPKGSLPILISLDISSNYFQNEIIQSNYFDFEKYWINLKWKIHEDYIENKLIDYDFEKIIKEYKIKLNSLSPIEEIFYKYKILFQIQYPFIPFDLLVYNPNFFSSLKQYSLSIYKNLPKTANEILPKNLPGMNTIYSHLSDHYNYALRYAYTFAFPIYSFEVYNNLIFVNNNYLTLNKDFKKSLLNNENNYFSQFDFKKKFFNKNQVYKSNIQQLIILEEDLDISPDFFEYFSATSHLLYKLNNFSNKKYLFSPNEADRFNKINTNEKFIINNDYYVISAWNDNGFKSYVSDVSSIRLSDYFPGLGWLMTKELYEDLVINLGWVYAYWDDWMRARNRKKNRISIYPEISRTFHIGVKGASKNLYGSHLSNIVKNEFYVKFLDINLDYLIIENYNKLLFNIIEQSNYVNPEIYYRLYHDKFLNDHKNSNNNQDDFHHLRNNLQYTNFHSNDSINLKSYYHSIPNFLSSSPFIYDEINNIIKSNMGKPLINNGLKFIRNSNDFIRSENKKIKILTFFYFDSIDQVSHKKLNINTFSNILSNDIEEKSKNPNKFNNYKIFQHYDYIDNNFYQKFLTSFQVLVKFFNLMEGSLEGTSRTSYKGVIQFWKQNNLILLIPYDYLNHSFDNIKWNQV